MEDICHVLLDDWVLKELVPPWVEIRSEALSDARFCVLQASVLHMCAWRGHTGTHTHA